MKKKMLLFSILATMAFSFAGCGNADSTSSNESTVEITTTTVKSEETAKIKAETDDKGNVVLDESDDNVKIETNEDGEKVATIKSDDGSEVKVAVKTNEDGKTVIDTDKVVNEDGKVEKADSDEKTEVKVDDDGNVEVVVVTTDSEEVPEPEEEPKVTTTKKQTEAPTVTEKPKSTTTKKDSSKPTTTEAPKETEKPRVTTPKPETTKPRVTEAPKVTTTPKPETTKPKTTEAPKVTTKPKTTTPKVTEPPKPTTTVHVHNWVDVTKDVYHEAKYETKTIWMYSPNFYDGSKLNSIVPYANDYNRLTPNNVGWYNMKNDYDLLCWHYNDTIENIYNKKSNFAVEWITKDTYKNYGISDWEHFDQSWDYDIGTYDEWGNRFTFNPNLDIVVCLSMDTIRECRNALHEYADQVISTSSMLVDNCYMPVSQETVKVSDAYTETVKTGRRCTTCGKES